MVMNGTFVIIQGTCMTGYRCRAQAELIQLAGLLDEILIAHMEIASYAKCNESADRQSGTRFEAIHHCLKLAAAMQADLQSYAKQKRYDDNKSKQDENDEIPF